MRKLPILAAAVLPLVLGMNLALAWPFEDKTPPELVDITLSRSSVAIAGLNVALVTVSVHLKDDSGVVDTCDQDPDCHVSYPHVWFTRVSGGHKKDGLNLHLTSGTRTDGFWTRDWIVPSPHNGIWEVTRVQAFDESRNFLDVDPRQQDITRSLAVHASHIPNVTMGFAPDPHRLGQSITVKGRAYYTDTGAPIPKYRLYFGQDEPCLDLGNKAVVTDERGYWSYPIGRTEGVTCVFLWRTVPTTTGLDDVIIVGREDVPIRKLTISVRLSDDRVALGSTTAFQGSSGVVEHPINLQRFTAGAWRTVNTSRIRRSGRYTLIAQPPARGRFAYRVWMPATSAYESGTVSRTYVVTAY